MRVLTSLVLVMSLNALADQKKAFDKAAYEQVAQRHINLLQSCYDKLKSDPMYSTVDAKLVLNWDVTRNGSSDNYSVTSSNIANPKFQVCILEALKKLKFPRARGKEMVHISYPLILSKDRK